MTKVTQHRPVLREELDLSETSPNPGVANARSDSVLSEKDEHVDSSKEEKQILGSKPKETILPAESAPEPVDNTPAVLSPNVMKSLGLLTDEVELVERGEVESVVAVNGKHYVVGNEDVKEGSQK